MTARADRLLAGLCTNCGGERDLDSASYRQCSECREVHRQYAVAVRMRKHPMTRAVAHKRLSKAFKRRHGESLVAAARSFARSGRGWARLAVAARVLEASTKRGVDAWAVLFDAARMLDENTQEAA